MNKRAFLEELGRLTGAMPGQERQKLLDYYEEMIDDRVEEGIPEEEAVAALGDPADIAREFAPAGVRETAGPSAQSVGALNGLRVRAIDADVAVVREAIPGGAAAQLRFSQPERFTWRMDGDVLVVEEKAPGMREINLLGLKLKLSGALFESGLKVTVALAGDLAGEFDFESRGGDLTVNGVNVGGGATLSLASGDAELAHVGVGGDLEIGCKSGNVRLDDVRVGGSARVKSASGDVEAANLAVAGDLALNSASGDVTLRELRCGALDVSAMSGDVEIDRGSAGATRIQCASGDIRLDELESDPELQAETASGDVELTRCIARRSWIKTMAGDVSLRLEPLPCGYDISADTRSGDISLPRDNPAPQAGDARPTISVQSMSGDIEAKLL